MAVLPDILTTGLKVVFCGTAVGERSAARGHYYAGRGNDFWRLLKDAGLTPRLLTPEKGATLPDYGLGLTDLVKNIAQSHDRGLVYEIEGFRREVATFKPRWVAFTSTEAGKVAAKALGQPAPGPWSRPLDRCGRSRVRSAESERSEPPKRLRRPTDALGLVARPRPAAPRCTLRLGRRPDAYGPPGSRSILWRRLDLAVLLVTHDIEEALFMAHRVLVLGARPTKVAHVMDVDLPRPRGQVKTKALPRFAELRGELSDGFSPRPRHRCPGDGEGPGEAGDGD